MLFFKRKPKPASHQIYTSPEAQFVMEKNYQALSQKGYEHNVIVYRCINLIAKSAASVPLVLYNDKHEREGGHPLKDLLKRPTQSMNYQSFMEALISYYLLSGNVYAVFHKGQFLFLRPDTVSIITDDEGNILQYRGEKEKIYEAQNVLHIKTFHPRQSHYGLSPLEAASFAIEQHNTIAHHNIYLMKNGGRPSGALLCDRMNLTDEQRQDLKAELNQMYAGEGNAGRMLLLDGSFKWVEMGLSPKDMDFLEAKNKAASEIATCFGISPLLVGLMEHASYSNYKEARMQFWQDTVLPLLSKIVSEMNAFLGRFFDSQLHFVPNTDGVIALAEQHDALWNKLVQCAFLTDNEKREAVGYSPHNVVTSEENQ